MADDREFAITDPEVRNRLGEVLKLLRSAVGELNALFIRGVTEEGHDRVENKISEASAAAQVALDVAGEALMHGPVIVIDGEEETSDDDEDANDGG